MPVGMEIFDVSGNVIFDTTTPVAKFLGIASIGTSHTGSTASGSIYDSRLTSYSGHTGFVAVIQSGFDNTGNAPKLWVSGNYVYWQYLSPYNGTWNRPNATFVYGVI